MVVSFIIKHPPADRADRCVSHIVDPSNVSVLGAFLKEELSNEIQRFANLRLSLSSAASSAAAQSTVVPTGFTGTIYDPTTGSSASSSSHNPPITPERQRQRQHSPLRDTSNRSPTKLSAQASDQSLAASLPIIAKYLLVASYFASFNTVKSDVIHFVKIDEGIAKKGKKGRKAIAKKPGTGLKVCSLVPIRSAARSEELIRWYDVIGEIDAG